MTGDFNGTYIVTLGCPIGSVCIIGIGGRRTVYVCTLRWNLHYVFQGKHSRIWKLVLTFTQTILYSSYISTDHAVVKISVSTLCVNVTTVGLNSWAQYKNTVFCMSGEMDSSTFDRRGYQRNGDTSVRLNLHKLTIVSRDKYWLPGIYRHGSIPVGSLRKE